LPISTFSSALSETFSSSTFSTEVGWSSLFITTLGTSIATAGSEIALELLIWGSSTASV
jgi:hypothetical protein